MLDVEDEEGRENERWGEKKEIRKKEKEAKKQHQHKEEEVYYIIILNFKYFVKHILYIVPYFVS